MNQHLTLPNHITKFRLGLYMGDFSQPISLSRCLGPFSAMAKEDPRLELVFPFQMQGGQDVGWAWLARCDAIYYSHPINDFDLSVLWLARTMGVPVWSEYVDDVFHVLPTNPHWHEVKNKRAVREKVTQAIQWSTVVSTISEHCRAAFPDSKDFFLLPDACLWPPWDLPRRKCVTWRGLGSHAGDAALLPGDVESVLPQLCAVAKDFPDWEWALMGEPTEEFIAQLSTAAGRNADGKSRVKVAPFYSTPFHMMQAWGGCAPYLHLVPLADNEFNRAKGYPAYLEASAIGAAVIAPDHLPEWRQPGVIPYHESAIVHADLQDFGTVLRREMLRYEANGAFHPNVAAARAAIYPDRTLPEINQIRWAILRQLIAPSTLNHQPSTEFISYSQSGQDRWVYERLVKGEGLTHGTFLDIGCGDAQEINNTLALEKLGWRGIRLDLDAKHAAKANTRSSPFVQADATSVDWYDLLHRHHLNAPIDYVSIDTEPVTLQSLQNLLKHGIGFRALTIEHDSYHLGNEQRDEMRRLLTERGYTLARADVCVPCQDGVDRPFEDWWIGPERLKAKC